MTAVVAGIYDKVISARTADGVARADALAAGLSRSCLALAIFSASAIALAFVVTHRPGRRPQMVDYAAAAASTTHTVLVEATDDQGNVDLTARQR